MWMGAHIQNCFKQFDSTVVESKPKTKLFRKLREPKYGKAETSPIQWQCDGPFRSVSEGMVHFIFHACVF